MQHSNQQPSLTLTCVDRVLSQAFHKHQKKASADPNYKGPNGMFQGMGPGGMIMQYEHMHTWFCGQEGNKVKAVCNKEKKAAKGPHPLFAKNHAAHNDWMEMANGCVLSVYGTSAPQCPSLVDAFVRSLRLQMVRYRDEQVQVCVQGAPPPSQRWSLAQPAEPRSRPLVSTTDVRERRGGRVDCGISERNPRNPDPRSTESRRDAPSHIRVDNIKTRRPQRAFFIIYIKCPHTHTHPIEY